MPPYNRGIKKSLRFLSRKDSHAQISRLAAEDLFCKMGRRIQFLFYQDFWFFRKRISYPSATHLPFDLINPYYHIILSISPQTSNAPDSQSAHNQFPGRFYWRSDWRGRYTASRNRIPPTALLLLRRPASSRSPCAGIWPA